MKYNDNGVPKELKFKAVGVSDVKLNGTSVVVDNVADLDLKNREVVVGQISSKNLCDKSNIQSGSYSAATGQRVDYDSRACTKHKIKVKPNTTYCISNFNTTSDTITNLVDAYTLNGTYISRIGNNLFNGSTFTTTATTEYINITVNHVVEPFHWSDFQNLFANGSLKLMVCEGNVINDYFPHQNLDGEEIYSTEEQVIGRWINGKKLYRKVFVYTSYATNYEVPMGGLEDIVNIKGFVRRSDYPSMVQQIPCRTNNNDYYIQFNAFAVNQNNFQIQIEAGNNLRNLISKLTFIVEYTKISD